MKVTTQLFVDDHPLQFKRLAVCKDKDLVLDQFGKFFAAVFKQHAVGADDQTISINDTGGAARTVYVYSNQAHLIYCDNDDEGMLVAVGTDGTTPTRSDTNLGAQVDTTTAIGGDAVWTSANGTVTMAGSVAAAANRSLQECGLIARWQDSLSARRNFLLFRDTFPVVSVAIGKFATCAYTLQL